MEKLHGILLQVLADGGNSPERLKVVFKTMKAKTNNAHVEQNLLLFVLTDVRGIGVVVRRFNNAIVK
ncbi:hypothetical protein ACFQPC_07835 [Herminiimonas glaciei]|uniref:Uncharacterized protein n=1 Tax=Herminiimonas glaciei TaxID=523788 RepID=A0ABW2IAH0_9BURK